jgi:hypothetical protein
MLTDGGDENYGGMFFANPADVSALTEQEQLDHAKDNSLQMLNGNPDVWHNDVKHNQYDHNIFAPKPAPDRPSYATPPPNPPFVAPIPNIPINFPVAQPFIPAPPPDNRIAKEQRKKEKEDAHNKKLKDMEDALDKKLKDREDADERRRLANEARSNLVTRNIIFRDYDYDRENRLRLLALGLIPDFPYISKNNLEDKVNELIKKELKKDTTAAKPSTDEEMVKLIKIAIDSVEPKKKSSKKASKPKKKSSKKASKPKKKSSKKKSNKKK